MVQGRRMPTLSDGALHRLAGATEALVSLKTATSTAAAQVLALLHDARSVLRWWRTIPTLDLELNRGAAGSDISRELAVARWGPRARPMLAVAELPEHADDYLVGRSRQAVRTNRSRAQRQGLRAIEATGPALVEQCLERLEAHGLERFYLDAARGRLARGLGRFWVVIDAERIGLALASVSADTSVARVNAVHVVPDTDASAVRYLLASQIFLDLAAEKVRHVVTDRAVRTSPGVLYLQDRLGYRPRRVRLTMTD